MDVRDPPASEGETEAGSAVAGETGSKGDGDDAVVVCDSIGRSYSRGGGRSLFGRSGGPVVVALDGVSLSVSPGEFVGIAGPSGSGKSTLLHLLAALDVPTEGTVTLAGTDTGTCSAGDLTRLRRRHVGIVFQRFHLLPSLSARSNVALPLVEFGVGKSARRERAAALLERVGLGERATHRPGELSGGEQQRVAIARALATDPELLIADEPTGELDTETGERVLEVLDDLAAETAVVVASHDDRTLEHADRVVWLRDGRRVEDR